MGNKQIYLSGKNNRFWSELAVSFRAHGGFSVDAEAPAAHAFVKKLESHSYDAVLLDEAYVSPYCQWRYERSARKLDEPQAPVSLFFAKTMPEPASWRRYLSYCLLYPVSADMVIRRVEQFLQDMSSPAVVYHAFAEPALRNDSLPQRAAAQLHEIGMASHLLGYRYLRDAIVAVYQDIRMLNNMNQYLYAAIAATYGTTPVNVERSIRHAIEATWTRGNLAVIENLFGYTVRDEKGKPTNAECIALLADHLRLKSAG